MIRPGTGPAPGGGFDFNDGDLQGVPRHSSFDGDRPGEVMAGHRGVDRRVGLGGDNGGEVGCEVWWRRGGDIAGDTTAGWFQRLEDHRVAGGNGEVWGQTVVEIGVDGCAR